MVPMNAQSRLIITLHSEVWIYLTFVITRVNANCFGDVGGAHGGPLREKIFIVRRKHSLAVVEGDKERKREDKQGEARATVKLRNIAGGK